MTIKYNIKWTRPQDEEVFQCIGLSATELARRLKGAVKNFGQITILEVIRYEPRETLY
jgi:hypothetical protein